MNAIGINDGYLIIVRRQDQVENGEVAVVLVDNEDATVKRFYATDSTVTLCLNPPIPSISPRSMICTDLCPGPGQGGQGRISSLTCQPLSHSIRR